MPQVLVVDDSKSARMDAVRALSAVGISTIEIEDPAHAISAARHHQPDLILLDVMMPGINGLGVLRQLRSDPRTAEIPVIVVSALANIGLVDDLAREGAVSCVPKPFGHEELRQCVAETLRNDPRAAGEDAPTGPGHVTAFLGVKGGVGTTTVALNVAATWASQGASVALAELRATVGTMAARLNQCADWSLETFLLQDDLNEQDLVQRLLYSEETGLELLCGPNRPIPPTALDPDRISSLIEMLAARSQHVVLDLPADNSKATAAALALSHSVVLVLEHELTSVVAARAVRDLLAECKISVPTGLVIVQQNIFLPRLSRHVVEAELERPVVGTIAPAAESLDSAIRVGLPLVLAEPDHPSTTGYRELARQLDPHPSPESVRTRGICRTVE